MAHHQDDKENGSFLSPARAPQRTSLMKRAPSTASLDMDVLSTITVETVDVDKTNPNPSAQTLPTCSKGVRKKRKRDEDAISLQSLDAPNAGSSSGRQCKRHSLARMSSFVNILSPVAGRIVRSIERSFNSKAQSPADLAYLASPGRKTKLSTSKEASCTAPAGRLWSDMVDAEVKENLNEQDCKLQESIHELLLGEEDLIADLEMVDRMYRNSMATLRILSEDELDQIFGIVQRLVPCHQDLLLRLRALRGPTQVIEGIGKVLLDWIPSLRQYETYCANQVFAKALLDCKKNEPRVDDFLQRCRESSFSRRLDLWNFLDLPRSRLVKYPLLLRQILKYTGEDTDESRLLQESIRRIEDIIRVVDLKMGESKCQQAIAALDYAEAAPYSSLIRSARLLLCSGELKNDRGTKLHVFLFDHVVVLTRPGNVRNGRLRYQVCKDLIPVASVQLDDVLSAQLERSGSFRSNGGSSKKASTKRTTTDRLSFSLTYGASNSLTTITLTCRDEHDRKQWLSCLKKAKSGSDSQPACGTPTVLPSSSTSEGASSAATNPDSENSSVKLVETLL